MDPYNKPGKTDVAKEKSLTMGGQIFEFGRGAVAKVQLTRMEAPPTAGAVGEGVRVVTPPPDVSSSEEFPPLASSPQRRKKPRTASGSRGSNLGPRVGGDSARDEDPRSNTPATSGWETPAGDGRGDGDERHNTAAGTARASPPRTGRTPASSARKRKGGGRGAASARDSVGDDGDTESSIAEAGAAARRGRNRALRTGDYVGRAEAARAAARVGQEQEAHNIRRDFAAEIAAKVRGERRVAERRSFAGRSCPNLAVLTEAFGAAREVTEGPSVAVDLLSRASSDLEDVARVAATSRNLKGDYVRTLKGAVTSLSGVMTSLADRTSNEEVRRLEAAVRRLKAENEDLYRELRELRGRFEASIASASPGEGPPASSPATLDRGSVARRVREREKEREREREKAVVHERGHMGPPPAPATTPTPSGALSAEDLAAAVMAIVGPVLDARFGAFEDRLLPERRFRPPLRADTTGREPERPKMLAPTPSPVPPMANRGTGVPVAEGAKKKKKRRRKEGPAGGPSQAAGASVVANAPTGSASADRGQGPSGLARTKARPPPPPPPPPSDPPRTAGQQWTEVVKRGKKGRSAKSAAPPANKPANPTSAGGRGKGGKGKAGPQRGPPPAAASAPKKKPRLRPPRTAAIVISLPSEGGISLSEAMSRVQGAISLKDLGIEGSLRPKMAVTGGLILEIPGPDNAAKADGLAAAMREVLAPRGVAVTRPVKTSELRVSGLVASATPPEIARAVALAGECPEGAVTVGAIRTAPSGLGTAWVKCPVAAAKKLMAAARVQIGWVAARVEVLPPRPLQCHRCLALGHTRQRCAAPQDRSGLCFHCGQGGHKVAECPAKAPFCAVCADLGRPARHRLGGKACAPPPKTWST